MREPHPLTSTKNSTVPRRMVFFDSEAHTEINATDEEIQRAVAGEEIRKPHDAYLLIANFYTRPKDGAAKDRYRTYYSEKRRDNFLKRFWEDVDSFCRTNARTYVFAHNAKYDVQVCGGVHYLVQLGYTVTGFSDANPFILTLEKLVPLDSKGKPYMIRNKYTGELEPKPRKKTLIILSSTNYYSQSLASLGKIFKLPKLDFEHGVKVDMSDPEDRERAITYAKRDVEILAVAMKSFFDFIEREDLGPFARTVAGQAFTAFRHRFMEEDMIYIHDNVNALEVERRAYAGGRNECFKMGTIPGLVTVCDINSMYPYVMKTHLYPTRLVSYWKTSTPERVLQAIQDDYLICADVRVRTSYPIFHKREQRLIFPVGDFWTSLTTPELIQAYERGLIMDIKNVCLYEAGNIFEDYVDFFYGERLKAKENKDAIHDHLYKIFLNSLYGKFGQTNAHWDIVGEADPDEIGLAHGFVDGKNVFQKIFGGKVFQKNTDPDDQEAFNSFPAVAAHVTGYARMLIWSIMESAGLDNVYYTDTDSVFVNDEGYARLLKAGMIDSKRLGALKMEKKGYLWLNGCKDYMFLEQHDRFKMTNLHPIRLEPYQKRQLPRKVRSAYCYTKEVKIKGIPKNAVPLGENEEGKLQFAVTQWGGFTDRFRSKDFKSYYNKVIIKTLSRDYSKAEICGADVVPFTRDYLQDEQEEARKVLELARKEAAAAMQEDMIRLMCLQYGFMRVPERGDRYHGEYNGLPKVAKMKYFRRGGVPLDIWAEDNGFTVKDLFDYLRG